MIDLCTICERPRADHDSMQHLFQGKDGGELIARKPEGPSVASSSPDGAASKNPEDSTPHARGMDPVLRAILVSKGLVTVDEIQSAERELRENGILVVREGAQQPGGNTGDDRRDRETRDGSDAERDMRTHLPGEPRF